MCGCWLSRRCAWVWALSRGTSAIDFQLSSSWHLGSKLACRPRLLPTHHHCSPPMTLCVCTPLHVICSRQEVQVQASRLLPSYPLHAQPPVIHPSACAPLPAAAKKSKRKEAYSFPQTLPPAEDPTAAGARGITRGKLQGGWLAGWGPVAMDEGCMAAGFPG